MAIWAVTRVAGGGLFPLPVSHSQDKATEAALRSRWEARGRVNETGSRPHSKAGWVLLGILNSTLTCFPV